MHGPPPNCRERGISGHSRTSAPESGVLLLGRLNAHDYPSFVPLGRHRDAAGQEELLPEQAMGRMALDAALGRCRRAIIRRIRFADHDPAVQHV